MLRLQLIVFAFPGCLLTVCKVAFYGRVWPWSHIQAPEASKAIAFQAESLTTAMRGLNAHALERSIPTICSVVGSLLLVCTGTGVMSLLNQPCRAFSTAPATVRTNISRQLVLDTCVCMQSKPLGKGSDLQRKQLQTAFRVEGCKKNMAQSSGCFKNI